MAPAADDDAWLRRAVDLATASVEAGGGPFGAVVVRDGVLLAEGQNRVTRDVDPTAHAEVVAIRAACRAVGHFSLPGATVYSSCEPCPLCLAAALWARVGAVLYAADRRAAAASGFDDHAFHELLGRPDRADWPMPVVHRDVDGALRPHEAWRAHGGRVEY